MSKRKRLSATRLAARAAARESKRKEAAMASVEELAAVLGVGLNQAYVALQMGQIPALRFGRRWLISRKTIDRITNGEIPATAA
jgi:excisionase family DNA binding protein